MPTPMLYQVLYVSTLSPDQPLNVVADIAHRARAANAAMGISALLIFDGQNFCQMLEGDRKPVLALTERIRADTRHTGVEVLHFGPLAARRFRDFQLAFTNGEEDSSFAHLEVLDGEVALAEFESRRAALGY